MMQAAIDSEPALFKNIVGEAVPSAADFWRVAGVNREWRTAAEAGMDWKAAYLAYHRREPHIPWIVVETHENDQYKWRVRHKVRALHAKYQQYLERQSSMDEDSDETAEDPPYCRNDANGPEDVSIRLEAALNGRLFIGSNGIQGQDISPTEGPRMCEFVEHTSSWSFFGPDAETDEAHYHAVRNHRSDNYGSRTPGSVIWTADGKMYLCDERWKVQSMDECYSYQYEPGEEPLPFQADWAQVDTQFTGGKFHINERQFWMTMIYFSYIRSTGFSRIDASLEVLFKRTQKNGGVLPRCIQCGSRGSGDEPLQRCARCKSAWYCDRACQKAAWPSHKLYCQAI